MSQVRIKYDNVLPFFSVGPTPLVSIENQNQYSNSEIISVDTVTLNGRVKRTDGCNGGFSNVKALAEVLIGKFSKNFKTLLIEESMDDVDDGIFYPLYSWENCLVRSISFDEDNWYDWIPYTIVIDCYKNGYFSSNGITDPVREVSVENLEDNTISLTITCSCRGLNNNNQGFQNARQFAYDNSAYLASDLSDTYWSNSSIHSATPYLVSEVETFNRFTGTVSITRSYVIQDSSLGFSRGVLKYTREISTNDVGETIVTINGEHQGSFRDDTTLLAIEDDIKDKNWHNVANELFIENSLDVVSSTSTLKNKVLGKTASPTTQNIWSTYDTSTLTFVKNPNCWANDIDLSGLVIAAREPGFEGKKLGAAISPRHYAFAWHYKLPLAVFTASISGTVMTVTSISSGYIGTNQELTASLITAGTTIVNQLTGTAGSTGTYTISASQTRVSQTINGNQRIYFLDRDGGVVSRLVTQYLQSPISDIGIGLLDSDLPSNVSFFKVLPPDREKFITMLGQAALARDKVDSTVVIHTATIRGIGTELYVPPPNYSSTSLIYAEEPMVPFYGSLEDGDSDSPMILILDDEPVLIGHIYTFAGFIDYFHHLDNINSTMATLGGGYSLTYFYPRSYYSLFSSPTNFNLTRNLSNNSVQFSIEYSNKKFNDVYVIDETKIIENSENSSKCIEVSLSIKSDLKCEEARWNAVVTYYSDLDFIQYVQDKWEKYGNSETLNFNTKQGLSYSENKFQGTIDVSATFCIDSGQSCGCLQDFNYQYSFVPPLKEYKISIPKESQGCHYIEDLLIYKRASFSIRGNVISSLCCSYDKTVMELKNRLNQISNSLFYGERKILDSVEISKNESGGAISFEASWSAKKDPFIPESLL